MPTSPTDSTGTSKPNTTPTTIRIGAASRTDQKIDVTATVLTADGNFVPNVTLAFSVDAGTITPNSAVTDSNGSARATAATPSSTTVHVSGAGLTAQTSLPASIAAPVSDSVILNVPGTGTTGVAVTMFVSSTGGGPFSWTFGDGGTAQTTGFSTTHTYGRSGSYGVMVTNANGAFSSGNINVVDAPAPAPTPTPMTSASVECTPGTSTTSATVTVTGCHVTLTGADGSPLTSSITVVGWDWGDGTNNTTLPAPHIVEQHQYLVSGTYLVIAKVTASGGPFNAETSVKIP